LNGGAGDGSAYPVIIPAATVWWVLSSM